MSKSIWHTAGFHEAIDDKLKVSKDGKWVYWTMYGWNIAGKDAHDIGCEWAYLDDLLALETELERTRKALDYAIGVIQTVAKMSDKLSKEYGETLVEQLDNIQAYCWQEGYVLTHKEDLERAITALEQKD